jgi:hypothetical protein
MIAGPSDQNLKPGPPKYEAGTLTTMTTNFKNLGNFHFAITETGLYHVDSDK